MKFKTLQIFLFLFFVNSALFGESNYFLCIDGGGSKTALQVMDQKGQLLPLFKNNIRTEKIEAGGSNINVVGKEGVRTVLKSLFDNVQIGNDSTNLIDILPQCQIVAGMAGVGLPKNKQSVVELFAEHGIGKENIFVMSDAELALQLMDEQGIILISGTGSICLGKRNLTVFRVGGLGRILGDEGSGYQIGLQALKAALAEEYGWGASSSLTLSLKEFFNVEELKSLIPEINLGEIPPLKIASCAPLVFKEAWGKDAVAEEIINHAAIDLGTLLAIQLKISNLSNCEVHLWGGIFKNPYTEAFIQTIKNVINDVEQKNLKIINKSNENVAVLYTSKYLLSSP
jgi:N-acetylglucosamine kinase-like BadF-type ATPase